MAGQVIGGEVAFTGPQSGQTVADDLIEGSLRDIMLGTDPATIALNPSEHAYGHSNQAIDGNPDQNQGPTLEQLEQLERVRQNTPNQGEQNWQQLYGQSENEKGELRRQLQAAQDAQAQFALQQQMQQQMQMQMQMQQQMQPPPQPQYGPPPQLFPGKTRDDVVTLAEIEDRLVPAMHGIYNEAQAANARYQALENQIVQQRKIQSGITPIVEFQVLAENPWINGLGGAAKVDAMATVLALKKAQTPAQPQAPLQPQAPRAAAPQRLLYVEQGRPTANEPRANDPQMTMQQEWAATMLIPLYGGKREEAQKAVLQKYGAQSVSGFRDPNILTR